MSIYLHGESIYFDARLPFCADRTRHCSRHGIDAKVSRGGVSHGWMNSFCVTPQGCIYDIYAQECSIPKQICRLCYLMQRLAKNSESFANHGGDGFAAVKQSSEQPTSATLCRPQRFQRVAVCAISVWHCRNTKLKLRLLHRVSFATGQGGSAEMVRCETRWCWAQSNAKGCCHARNLGGDPVLGEK